MKTTFQFFAVPLSVAAALLVGTCHVRADDNTKTSPRQHHVASKSQESTVTKPDRRPSEVQGGVVGGTTGPEYRVLTGSHLPEHYNRRGYTTDSKNNELILDHNDIRLQNSDTVGDALRQVPGVTVGGRR